MQHLKGRKYMFRFIVVILTLVSLGFSQQDNAKKRASQTESEEIIQKARQAIGLDKSRDISSYFYKNKTTLITQSGNFASFEEVSHTFPGKIRVVYINDFLKLQSSRTWNDDKYKAILESESSSGQRTVRDISAVESKPLSKTVSKVLGNKTTSALQNFQKADPKKIFAESLWTSIFPLTLSHPFEKKIEFKYAGKAKSNDKTAYVVDVKPSNGRTYRLLFDSETNYLLMMIVSFKETNDRFVGDVEEKYYYSERKLFGDVLVPTKIKVEKRATPAGQAPVVGFSNIEILEFELNPKFDEKVFEIK